MGKNRKETLCCPTRRQALGMIGSAALAPVLFDPVRVLLNGLVDGILAKAQAVAAGVPPRRYVYVGLPGGKARWAFDQPLVPYSGSAVMRNPHVVTRFQDGGSKAGAPVYATVPVTRNGVTLHMPHLWGSTIPVAGGGTVPMADLLTNMLIIRGVNMAQDGHATNFYKQTRPVNSAPSLDGRVADHSSAPVPAVGMPGGSAEVFKSEKGIGLVYTDDLWLYGNPLSKILAPFDAAPDAVPSGFMSRRLAMETAVNQAMASLATEASQRMPGSENLYSLRNTAEQALKNGIGDVLGAYTRLRDKYQAIARATVALAMPGITDKPAYLTDLATYNAGKINQTILSPGSYYVRNPDLTTLIGATTMINGLAESLAVAEYLILQGYSTSVSMGGGGIQGVRMIDYRESSNPGVSLGDSNEGYWYTDEHGGGSVTGMILNSLHFRVLAACLYEFVQALKRAGLFNETVIQISSEFGRTPRKDESGSDHGWMAQSTSLISGVITRPTVLGNVRVDGSAYGGDNPGSWGAAALTMVENVPQELTIGHMTSTVAELLRVEPIMPNNKTLVTESGGAITPTVELAREV
jgi:hypothetical protein